VPSGLMMAGGGPLRQGVPFLLPPYLVVGGRGERTAVWRDRAAGPAHNPGQIGIAIKRSGQVGAQHAGKEKAGHMMPVITRRTS
jgi:hypothetical protein